ncbi:SdpI family protein [Chitinophaga sp.]|uniref:SdpI family protein n=1 Tax=Chitinophaga sp. TaxID=1869181 RepID=UPI0031D780B9
MKTNKWLRELPFALLIAIPWIVFFIVKDQLPATVPAHYSVGPNGWVVDSYMRPAAFVTIFSSVSAFIYLVMTLSAGTATDKATWLYYFKLVLIIFFDLLCIGTLTGMNMGTDTFSNLVMAALCLIINGFVFWIFRAGKKSGKQPISEKYYNIIWAGTHFISSLPLILTLFAARQWGNERTLVQAVFLFIAVISNLTNSVKPNHFIGIRTPWTLADEGVWRKTHQVCSRWFFISALTGFVLSIVLPIAWLPRLLIILPLSCTAYAMIYSYWLYRKRGDIAK